MPELKDLPDISKEMCLVFKHYIQEIKGLYPEYKMPSQAEQFLDAWIALQKHRALWLYRAESDSKSNSKTHLS